MNPMVEPPYLVHVTGPPGIGKTTLVKGLVRAMSARAVLSDALVEGAPFLADAHRDPQRWTFHNQVWCTVHFPRLLDAVLARQEGGAANLGERAVVITDFSPVEVPIYGEAMAALGSLSRAEHDLLSHLWATQVAALPKANLTLWLSVPSPEILIGRIAARGRHVEKAMRAELVYELWSRFPRWCDDKLCTPRVAVDAADRDLRLPSQCQAVAREVARTLFGQRI